MTKDLLNFVDTRVTLNEHPLNQLIRNSIQLNFDELNNELKMHIGSEGVQYRLVRHMYSLFIACLKMSSSLFFKKKNLRFTETHD